MMSYLFPPPCVTTTSYCLCAGGLQAAFHGCEERADFTCAAVCAKLPKPTAAPPASAADRARGHGNAWARLAARAQKPAARQAAARIALAQMKRRAAARVAAAYAVREHAAKVAQADKLVCVVADNVFSNPTASPHLVSAFRPLFHVLPVSFVQQLGHTPKNAAEAKAQIQAMMKAIAPEVEWQRRRFEISAARLMPKRSDWWTEKRTLQFFKDFREKMAKQGAKDAKAQQAANKKRFDSIPGTGRSRRVSRGECLDLVCYVFGCRLSSSFRCIYLQNLLLLSSPILFTSFFILLFSTLLYPYFPLALAQPTSRRSRPSTRPKRPRTPRKCAK